MDGLDLTASMDELEPFLAEDVESDPRREVDAHTISYYRDYTRTNILTWPDTVRAYVGSRAGR